MHKNENRLGYKNSKVGWIPVEWDAFIGADISNKITKGSSPNWQGFEYQTKGVLFVTSENVRDGYLDISLPKFLPIEFNLKLKNSVLQKEDILINIVGASIGRVCKFPGSPWPANVNQAVCVFRCKNNVSSEYILSYFQTNIAIDRLFSSQVESARPNVSLTDIRDFPLALPPLPEQKAIAAVLECWDKGIRNLELKIEKKRLIKNGLMQQLLSGKLRLPGFGAEFRIGNGELRILNGECRIPEGWKRVGLGNAFAFVATYAFSRECLTTEAIDNSDIYNIHYGDIHATYTGPILDLAKERRVPMLKTSDALPDKLEFLQEGDLVMADVSEDYEGIGACVELKNLAKRKLTGGLHTFVMRDTSCETAAGFRGYMFNEYRLAKELKRIATGVSVYSLSKTNLAKIELLLPPLAEQQSITSVLWGADEEIAALEKKLALWKEQKKYLLNNLVTGTIRLPEFEL
jgi:type I restriction enzyme, S subunit